MSDKVSIRLTDTNPIRRPARAVERLRQLERLPNDWNSYGGAPPSHQAIEQALLVITAAGRLAQESGARDIEPFAVAPLADGGVSIVWKGAGGALDVEIEATGRIGLLFEPSDPATGGAVDCDNASLQEMLARIRQTLELE